MYVNKHYNLRSIMRFTGGHLIWIISWVTLVTCVYEFSGWKWMSIPWLPLSVIGTAVAFYVGFKNNQAYDRTWEARKIWGGIVNDSRSWGSNVRAYVSSQFTTGENSEEEIDALKKKLIFRHIAWLYTLRSQLLIPPPWEHIRQGNHIGKVTKKRMMNFGLGLLDDNISKDNIKHYLPEEEYERIINYRNSATQIIDQQSQDLAQLREKGLIDDFRHMDMQKIQNQFYTLQGKAERIKKFPLPRQYGSMSFIFVGIFIFLLPLGMVSEFHKMGDLGIWLSIPFSVLVAWVYIVMELVGDYSENPFEGLGNDIPMLALCRTIEIDLLEMIGETDLPEAIKPKNGVLL